MTVITAQLAEQIGVVAACRALGIPRSRLYTARRPQTVKAARRSVRALTPEERQQVRELLNSERFWDQPPRQVYATLLDEGTHLCHWRTMYRILADHHEVRERRAQRVHPVYHKPELLATAPNHVWSWDITKLLGPVTWTGYALYTVLDIFSRYVVGWRIEAVESGDLAAELVAESCLKQEIVPDQLILHADNGGPMVSQPLGSLLATLGVGQSHNRPHTSNDNPFSEAHFKTMKYRPNYPNRFPSIEEARVWAREFFDWYNHQHYHSGLSLLTPASVHYGQSQAICQQRQQVMNLAHERHPERFSKGIPTVKGAPNKVYINPPSTGLLT